jgi:hypothetical protein
MLMMFWHINSQHASSTATQDLATSVSAIGDQIARATAISHEASRRSDETTETMRRLAAMTGRIETVVQLINLNRRSDQPSGPQCHHRGRARRRSGQGMRRRRQ